MGHPQPPTPVATYNTSTNGIINGTEKQQQIKKIDMRFDLGRDRMWENHFHIFWEEENKNLADYFTKHHPILHHRKMRPIYLKATKKTYKTRNTGKLGSEESVMELPIPE